MHLHSLGALLNIFHGTEAPETSPGVRARPALSLIMATRPEQYYPEHLRGMYRQLREASHLAATITIYCANMFIAVLAAVTTAC
jgi:hypothetical protein